MKKYLLGLYLAISFYDTPIFAAQYSNSTTYQVVGNLTAYSANEAIIYIKLDAIATPTGSWGVNGISFRMNNTSNSMVKMALNLLYKLRYFQHFKFTRQHSKSLAIRLIFSLISPI